MVLPKKFYSRDAALVARELLGCVIVKKEGNVALKGKIVETEAYYGLSDPASRAKDKRIGIIMNSQPGIAFIYMVHGNWLFNITTMPKGNASGILIRAVEPIEGMQIMKKRRRCNEIKNLTSGPGKFTQAFGIDKRYNGIKVYSKASPICIKNAKKDFEIVESYRIGVKEDLPQPLRFYIKGNEFVSKK